MKEVKHYICEVCGTEYSDKNRANECEKNHKKYIEIVGARYLSKGQDVKGYPDKLDVKFSSGEVVTYHR